MKKNVGAYLLDKSQSILHPRDRIEYAHSAGDPASDELAMARIKVALDFGKKRGSFQLEAMVDGWDLERIKREMY